MSVKDSVTELIAPIISDLGYELVEVTYKKEHDAMTLTVYIDTEKEGGISLDDTEIVATAIDEPLDRLDPTAGAPYVLNVSSPGLDRPLKTEKDYRKKIGTEIEVSLYAAIDGKKKYVGVLTAFTIETISLHTKEGDLEISMKDIAVARPYITF